MPRLKIVFLGTGGTAPTKQRICSCVYMEYFGRGFLFDCPECVQRQMAKFGVSPAKIERIFLTHIHGDHIFGLPGLLHTMEFQERKKGLKIHVPQGQDRRLERFVSSAAGKFSFDVEIVPSEEGVLLDDKDFEIKAYWVKHTSKCLAYVFEERERVKADKEKLRALGLYNSPLVKKLKEGEPVVHNGKRITPEDVVYVEKGIKAVYAVDTRPVEHDFAREADALIHDGTFLERDKEHAVEKKHSTVKEAAELAKKLGAKKLYITHISMRYKNTEEIEREAKEVFENSFVPEDGYSFLL